MKNKKAAAYPPIPDKRFFPIGEAAMLATTQAHVLRYWEKEIPQLQKVARRAGRRYYTPADIALLRQIHGLIRDRAYTVNGVRLHLAAKKNGEPAEAAGGQLGDIRREITRIMDLL